MADRVEVRGTQVKLRSPWGAFFLSLVTLGIYYLVLYYRTNKELRDAAGMDVSPGVALLAITLGGFLIVPPFVSEWRYFKRIKEAEERAGVEHTISHVTGFALYLFGLILLPFEIPYAQHHLNRLWRHERDEAAKAEAGMRGEPAQV